LESEARILVVDDDADCCALMVDVLMGEGYQVFPYLNGEHALQALGQRNFDLVLTDIKMPAVTGIDLLHHVRERELPTQVILVTGYGELATAIEALRGQAFDYILKPFAINQLRQRVAEALASLPAERYPPAVTTHGGDLVIDRRTRSVSVAGRVVELTRQQYDVLICLARDAGCPVSTETLLQEVWDEERSTDTVKSCIRRLRIQLGDDAANPRYIFSVRGVGYKLAR
jgi:DNA-binding response OmpR family regulator